MCASECLLPLPPNKPLINWSDHWVRVSVATRPKHWLDRTKRDRNWTSWLEWLGRARASERARVTWRPLDHIEIETNQTRMVSPLMMVVHLIEFANWIAFHANCLARHLVALSLSLSLLPNSSSYNTIRIDGNHYGLNYYLWKTKRFDAWRQLLSQQRNFHYNLQSTIER